ncbi:S4 domain-containing protein [Vibrio lentus]|nr:S4 domain-containing protein [Vibrio lentus]
MQRELVTVLVELEGLIKSGRVSVNGQVAKLGERLEDENSVIRTMATQLQASLLKKRFVAICLLQT